MNENNKKIPPKVGAVLFFVFVMITVICLLCISNSEYKKKDTAFRESVADIMNAYGETIDSYKHERYKITVYVDSRRWNNSSDETHRAFMKEMYSLVRMSAITSGILDEHGVSLSFYANGKFIDNYQLVK